MDGSTVRLDIFVVDDDPETLRWLGRYLIDAGHAVLTATSVQDALSRFPKAGCPLLISDIGLPDGTGWDLLRKLQEDRSTAPVYAIPTSGWGQPSDFAASAAAGFRHHLVKPIDTHELAHALAEAARVLCG